MLIRPALAADGPAILALIAALADFERLPPPTAEAGARLLDHAFGSPQRVELWVAEQDGTVVAYAATFASYSTFLARPTLFLEDLFVHPDARRQGIARAILARLRDEARARGCGRFEWMVLDWNQAARDLYRDIGARELGEWRLCRVDL
jgi:GNAT superfamily N-acetyltransferase